ncbi:type VI secretion system tip protein TssI/VgrG [Photobacterium damselae subsp. damselae]|uniref:type VI secretion system Vgr family protein n=1 Tax=Photobacterium damselae TaxID=38293 RepID=UPI00311B0499
MNRIYFQLVNVKTQEEWSVVDFTSRLEMNSLTQSVIQIKVSLGSDPKNFLRQEVKLAIDHYGTLNSICGLVSNVSHLGNSREFSLLQLTVVPKMWLTTLRHNFRIFQEVSVPDIINTILSEHNITAVTFDLTNQYDNRIYCTQYQETDFEFIQRLCSEEGLSFTFSPEKDHVYFNDSKDTYFITQDSEYNPITGPVNQESYISSAISNYSITTSSVLTKDYNPFHPQNSLEQLVTFGEDNQLVDYHYPNAFYNDAHSRSAQIRAAIHQWQAHLVSLKGNDPSFVCGRHTTVSGVGKLVPIKIIHTGTQYQALEEQAGSEGTTYSIEVTAIPSEYQFYVPKIDKPNVLGTQLATVSGPEGEEIYCDEWGRVKIYFPWDRYNKNDDLCSCWVRVSSPNAGAQFGFVAIPRIGQEVLVSFLHGDPDLPYISGAMYNTLNKPPYELPQYRATTTLRSESYQGSGYNEMSFDNVGGKERIFVHAQKDYEKVVGQNVHEVIKGSQHTTVEVNEHQHIKGNKNIQIDGDAYVQSTGLHISSETLVSNQKSDSLYKSGGTHTVKASNVLIEASSKICLKVGGSFISISNSGVDIVGAKVGLNSGGAPLGAKEITATLPVLPNGVEQIADNPIEINMAMFKAALSNNIIPRKCGKE